MHEHKLLVYDRFTQGQWDRMSYEERRHVANRWHSEYFNNPKYWPITVKQAPSGAPNA
jgi:hypothetical protein